MEDSGIGGGILDTTSANVQTTNRRTKSSSSSSSPITTVIKASDTDPIFGTGKIMHDIEITNGLRKGYQISEEYKRPSFKVIGHNGIKVGTVWARQIAAIRDGAHGAPVGGISGTGEDGCYSIVISGYYHGFDNDFGDTIYYSDSKATSNKEALPIQTTGTKALNKSYSSRNPVRVLRKCGGEPKHCPKAGLRYDRLYRVVERSQKTNKLDGAYFQFKLERIKESGRWEQPPIVRDTPDQKLVNLINQVVDGITRRRT